MNQDEGEGHSFITEEAVRRMFAERGVDTIDGLTVEQYAARLDAAQEHQDRIVDAGDGWGRGAPLGPTARPSSWDPDVQRQHAMADPGHSADWNLQTDRRYVVDELDAAHDSGDRDAEMSHLGNAVHALEDSYSEAHMWRGDAVHSGDPTAPVEAINNFDWTNLTATGSGDDAILVEGTHDPRFDQAPVRGGAPVLGVDEAAITATKDVLERYEDSRGQSAADGDAAMQAAVDPYFQASDGGVRVNTTADAAFLAEDQQRWDIQRQQMADAGIDSVEFGGMDEALHLGARAVQGVESAADAVEQAASTAYDAVASAASTAVTAVADTAEAVYDEVAGAAGAAVEATENAVGGAVEAVENFFSPSS